MNYITLSYKIPCKMTRANLGSSKASSLP